jgi:hypothetical protein
MRVFSDKKSNMDFMMNGPRFQVNTIDGYENCLAKMEDGNLNGVQHYSNQTNNLNRYPYKNDLYLQDTFDGRQSIHTVYWPVSDQTYNSAAVREKFAFKTNEPDIYVVLHVYDPVAVMFYYVHVGTYPIYPNASSIPARTLTFSMDKSIWKYYANSSTEVGALGRTNQYVYYGRDLSTSSIYIQRASNATGSQGAAYITRTSDASKHTYTLEFPAQSNCIRYVAVTNAWPFVRVDLEGHKLGTAADRVIGDPTASWGPSVAKVYSPMKNFMCLKSFVNGEIPIMNE